MGYTLNADYRARKNPHPAPKNRVGGAEPKTYQFATDTNHLPKNPCPDNDPTPTKTASGVCYYGFRYDSQELGRWINRDPIGEWGGLNLYNFVGNDSLNYTDVSGLRRRGTPTVPDRQTPLPPNAPMPSPAGKFAELVETILGKFFGVGENTDEVEDADDLSEGVGNFASMQNDCLSQKQSQGGCDGCCAVVMLLRFPIPRSGPDSFSRHGPMGTPHLIDYRANYVEKPCDDVDHSDFPFGFLLTDPHESTGNTKIDMTD